MSTALSKWMDVLVEYGLDSKVSTVAIDHANRTWNVYFNGLSPEHFERATVQAMLRDFGLPEPSGQLLDFAATSSALYPTFGWDAAEIERVSFSTRTTDPAALPSHIEPKLGVLAAKAPYTYEGDRKLVFSRRADGRRGVLQARDVLPVGHGRSRPGTPRELTYERRYGDPDPMPPGSCRVMTSRASPPVRPSIAADSQAAFRRTPLTEGRTAWWLAASARVPECGPVRRRCAR